MAQETQNGAAQPKKRSKVFTVILIALVVGGAIFGFTKLTHAKHHIETDDAQVEANISPIIPRVSGYVKDIRVTDNQVVKKGDTMVILDDRDLRIRLEAAEAALVTAQNSLSSAKASTSAARSGILTSRTSVSAVDAQIDQAKVTVWRTTQDYNRYANLVQDHSITQAQFEDKQAAKETAEKQLAYLQEQRKQADQQTGVVTSQSAATSTQIGVANSTIAQRQVDVDDAKLNLSYTIITAPTDGRVSKVNTQLGQYLTAGQSTFSIVQEQNLWVVANYKETQFQKITVGQTVSIDIDAFPDHEFQAKVGSFAPATGARFALLPPDNSSGNFVKVVQRLPVRIEFSNPQDSLLSRVKPGMNVNVDIHTGTE